METSLIKSALMFLVLVPIIFNGQKTAASETHPFGNSHLTMEEGFQDLVNRLTIEEEAIRNCPAAEGLKIPEYQWRNEALHGISHSDELYVSNLEASVRASKHQLFGIKRVEPELAASEGIHFEITPEMMEPVKNEAERVLEKGDFRVYFGGSSPGDRSTELGIANTKEATFRLR